MSEQWKREDYLNRQKLRERGWTDAAMKRFLGESDRTGRNPYHRSGPEIKYWLRTTVEAIEQSPAFVDWLSQSKPRRRKTELPKLSKCSQREWLLSKWRIASGRLRDVQDQKTQAIRAGDAHTTRFDGKIQEDQQKETLTQREYERHLDIHECGVKPAPEQKGE